MGQYHNHLPFYSSRLVCMYVCHAHAILAVRAIKSVTKDTVVLNVRFAAILLLLLLLLLLYSTENKRGTVEKQHGNKRQLY